VTSASPDTVALQSLNVSRTQVTGILDTLVALQSLLTTSRSKVVSDQEVSWDACGNLRWVCLKTSPCTEYRAVHVNL
jgi:hypothetical protein